MTERDRAMVAFVAAHPWVVSEHVRRFLSLDSREGSLRRSWSGCASAIDVVVGHGLVSYGISPVRGAALGILAYSARGAFPGSGYRRRRSRHSPTGSRSAVADVHLALLHRGARDIWAARTLASARVRGLFPTGFWYRLVAARCTYPILSLASRMVVGWPLRLR